MAARKAYCDGPFGQLHYLSEGAGRPLILCHQSPTCSVQFTAVLPLLAARGIQGIAPDTPGFGMSDVPDFEPRVEDYASAVIALLDHLGFDSVAVAGHHTGAQVATEVALREPERVRRVVLHGPLLFEASEIATWSSQMLPFEKSLAPRADGSHMAELWNWRAGFAEGYRPEIMHKHVIPNLAVLDTAWYGHNACYLYDTVARTKALTQPCLVINNTGDALYPIGSRARELRPDFTFVDFEGGTVDAIDEMPDAWAGAVADFVSAG